MSLYTEQVRETFRSVDWPKRLRVDIIEYPTHLGIRFYRDNFILFKPADQLRIAEVLEEFMRFVRGLGIPIYMEKMESDSGGK